MAGITVAAAIGWRVEVHGDSMAPTLLPNDRLVMIPCYRLTPNQLVVLADPRHSQRRLIKRVVRVEGDWIEVRGDNASASTDSRQFGRVVREAVLGRVVYRYFPPDRAGWLQAGRRPQSDALSSDARLAHEHIDEAGVASPEYDSPIMVSNPKDLGRLLSPEFIERLDQLDLADLRDRRHQCEEIEVELSYVRRMAQGRLDLVHADLERRKSGAAVPDDLVDRLTAVLAHNVTSPGPGRLAGVMAPDMESPELTAELDGVIGPAKLVDLASLEDAEVKSLADALVKFERGVSAQRRALHERIDAFQAEVVRRYQSGEADVDNLLR